MIVIQTILMMQVFNPQLLIFIEIIMIANEILNELVPKSKITLEINSLGSKSVQEAYSKALSDYFSDPSIHSQLSEDSKARLTKGNSLRILDSKDPVDKVLSSNAPKISDYYDDTTLKNFDGLQNML